MITGLHPLCASFPRLKGKEFTALCEDIRAYGLRNPIVTYQDMILDGGNRHQACIETGIPPKFIEYDGDNPASFVLSVNLHRRHLSAGQHAAIVAIVQDWSKAHPSYKQEKKDGCRIAPLSTVAHRADQSGASHRTQQMADKLAKEDPALAKKVADGEISLYKAVKSISPETPPEGMFSAPKALKLSPDEKDKEIHYLTEKLSDREQRILELRDLVIEQNEENQRLKDAFTTNQLPEDEIEDAKSLIDGLRKKLKLATVLLDGAESSRNSHMNELADERRQNIWLRRELKKAKLLGRN